MQKNKATTKLQKLVNSNKHFQFIENGKIKCVLTGHQMLPVLETYSAYLKSKSYQKGLQSQVDLSTYQQYLIPYKDNKNFLLCRLTGHKIPFKKSVIAKHVNGKKFQRRFQQILNENEQQQIQQKEEIEDAQDVQVEAVQQQVVVKKTKNGNHASKKSKKVKH